MQAPPLDPRDFGIRPETERPPLRNNRRFSLTVAALVVLCVAVVGTPAVASVGQNSIFGEGAAVAGFLAILVVGLLAIIVLRTGQSIHESRESLYRQASGGKK